MKTHSPHYDPFERHVHPSGWRPALEVMPGKSAWPRILHFTLSFLVIIAFIGVVIGAVQGGVR